jgi:hypothetical protein
MENIDTNFTMEDMYKYFEELKKYLETHRWADVK